MTEVEQARADGRGEALISVCPGGFGILDWGASLDEQFSTEDEVNRAYGKYGVYAWKMHKVAQADCIEQPRWQFRRVPRARAGVKP